MTTDPLTGLSTTEKLPQWAGRHKRSHEGCSLVCLNIDNFAFVQMYLGHSLGDAMLLLVARALEEALPPTGAVMRDGSDQFLVVAPGMSAERCCAWAKELAQRATDVLSPYRTVDVMDKVKQISQYDGGGAHFLTLSAGYVVFHGDVDTDAALSAAHGQLHAAKCAGRNTVRGLEL